MKTNLLSLVVFLLLCPFSYAQLTEVELESQILEGTIGTTDFTGITSYRIFAHLENPSSQVLAILGDQSCPGSVTTTTSFYRHEAIPWITGSRLPEGFFGFIPELKYQSVLSIGAATDSSFGVPLSVSEEGLIPGLGNDVVTLEGALPEDEWEENFQQGGSVIWDSFNGGAVFTTPGGANSLGVGVNNTVFLGQFATSGTFAYALNLGVIDENGESIDYTNCTSDIPGLINSSGNCTSETACNYNLDAIEDDGSCTHPGDVCNDLNPLTTNDQYGDDCECAGVLIGCTDVMSCSYNADAIEDDGSCSYPGDSCNDSSLLTINDTFQDDCSCVGQISGCTDMASCSYNSEATIDNGSCSYAGDACDDNNADTSGDVYLNDCSCEGIASGCTDDTAINFDANAIIDDGSCYHSNPSLEVFVEENVLSGVTGTTNFTGFTQYRIFASLPNAETQMLTMLGDQNCPMDVSTTTSFYQNEFMGSAVGGMLVEAFIPFIPEARYDSYLTIGRATDISLGIPFGDDNDGNNDGWTAAGSTIGEVGTLEAPNDVWVSDFEIGGNVVINSFAGGGIFALPTGPNGFGVGVNNTVFLGQLVTNGYLSYNINLGVKDELGNVIDYTNCDTEVLGLSYSSGSCTSETACNYNPEAIEDDGSCTYPGDQCGTGIYNDVCECEFSMTGVVFIDDNFNGVQDPFEEGLPYQTVYIESEETQVITNDNGTFSFDGLVLGTYTVSVTYTGDWSNFTTPLEQEVELLGGFGGISAYFGVTNTDVPAPSACVDFYQSGAGVPCNDILNYNICYRNMSPYPISGVVEVVLDDLMSYNTSYPEADEVNGQTISWSFEDLSSWLMNFDDIVVNTPTEQSIGEFMVSSVTIYVWHEGELIPVTEQTITQEVTCAYDPNDITGTPEGYTDDHLVLPDTRMEYLIRFQNTGNAPAGRVLVVDTLDPGMDASTFQLIANSHSVMTTIQPSGRIEFLFDNINLPDSISDEPGSHGLVSFKVNFKDDIAIGEEVNSTAHIYFDNNPAVVTNTTWHTIHECGGESAFELSSGTICAGETVDFTSTNLLVEDYQWRIDGVDVGTESDYDQVFTESGDYEIAFLADNPICSESRTEQLTVYDVPVSEITEDGALLTASMGSSYQWYLNGESVEGATDQTYEITQDGSYSVEVTNANGCTTLSQSILLVSVNELDGSSISLYPNPMIDKALLEMSNGLAKTIRLTDAQGRLIRSWENITDQRVEIQRGALATGKYLITVEEGRIKKVVVLIIN